MNRAFGKKLRTGQDIVGGSKYPRNAMGSATINNTYIPKKGNKGTVSRVN